MQRFFVEPHQIDEAAHQIHIIGTDVNHISNRERKSGSVMVDKKNTAVR